LSGRALTESERASLKLILEDLRYLFEKEVILQEEIDDVLQNLKSDEVRSYISSLRYGSKPESALRESFIAGRSILLKYLFGEAMPEVRSDGFIDYLVKDEMGRGIALELKPLFEAEAVSDKSGKPILKRLRRKEIKPENYRDQILKYIREGEAQFVILTNLKEWFFYSKDLTPREVKPFCTISLFDFVKEYDVIGNLRDYLERKETESIRYELDRRFLESLKTWVEKLSEVEFTVDDRRKLELIIGLINKFIFIQTLDDYGVIEFNWIRKRWNHHEQMWQRKGKLMVLEKFFNELDDWFFLYYDTELFREKVLQYIKKDDGNIDKFYKNLQAVLGLTYLQMPLGAIRGIMQYNFRYIDEDVFGKAYETFLGEVRKEEGIYYTPKYITEYIVKNTVGRVFDGLLKEIRERLDREDFEGARDLAVRFTSIKVLDPACGSGSFLIKAVRLIVEKYRELSRLIEDAEKNYVKKHSSYLSSLSIPQEIGEKQELISEIKKIVGPKNDRELISRILVRHIHGVDLDKRALEVAKVNIWLEAIKLAPKEFRYDRLPPETNYILPNLEVNLLNGDTLIGLEFENTINLVSNHKEKLKELSRLRQEYINNLDPILVEKIKIIKQQIKDNLDLEFRNFLNDKSLVNRKTGEKIDLTRLFDLTKPFHWCAEFWFAYFDDDDDGERLTSKNSGFDVIIGNPPYGRIKQLIKEEHTRNILSKYYDLAYLYQRGNYNYYKLFLERCFHLLRDSGYFSMIYPTSFLGEQDSQPLRKLFFENAQILKILQFPEKTKVFQDVTQDVIILIYRKSKLDVDYSIEIRTNITTEELRRLNELDFLELKVSEIKDITGTDYRIPIFIKPKEEWGILRKISKIPPFKGNDKVPSVGEIGEGHLHETFDQEFLSEKNTGDLVVKGIHLDQYFVNLDPEGPQPRWVKKDAFLKKKPEAEENIRFERIIGRNTLNRAIRPRLRFTLLRPGLIITNAIKYIIPKDVKLDKYYIIGLLNSSILNWRFELFSSQNNIRNYEIEDLPFYRADMKTQKNMADKVKRVIELKDAHYTWFKFWRGWCTRLKNGEYSLGRILSEDARFMRMGEFSKAWTSKATFYPTESKMLNTVFNDFKVVGEVDRHEIRIYGLDENNREELVYEMEFSNRDLMLHTYCSLLQALESKLNIKTLSQLFEKTKVPIIKEVNKSPNELTPNMIKKTREEFEKWLEEKGIRELGADIVKIDNETEDLKARIDALVFKLYGLNEDEIKVVFDSLKTPAMYRSKVFEFFRKL
jgi:Alw26I/Eco31I/Esp3I family type II restriction m6 adenine DNA methyltransferase